MKTILAIILLLVFFGMMMESSKQIENEEVIDKTERLSIPDDNITIDNNRVTIIVDRSGDNNKIIINKK